MSLKKKKVTKKLFEQIMKKGAIFYGSFLVFRVIINLDSPQYAFVAPKNIAKTAVVRNKLRRRGYRALRDYNVNSGQGIFFYKKNTTKISFSEIKKDVSFLLKKARIIQ